MVEWDASSHAYAYSLWEKAIFSDGGEGCRRKIEMTGEPLVEGMLVGTPDHILSTSETHQVCDTSKTGTILQGSGYRICSY